MAWTSVKIAVFAPMPRAIVRMTVAANPGALANWRRANLKSVMFVMDGAVGEGKAGGMQKDDFRRQNWDCRLQILDFRLEGLWWRDVKSAI
jgi:hypothetical protein